MSGLKCGSREMSSNNSTLKTSSNKSAIARIRFLLVELDFVLPQIAKMFGLLVIYRRKQYQISNGSISV
jgi:hypothetical protein